MIKVSAVCTVIPDGVEAHSSPTGSSLRFSVLLTPCVVDERAGDPYAQRVAKASAQIELERWPQAITALLTGQGGMRIHLRRMGEKSWRSIDARLSRHDAAKFGSQTAIAQRTWDRAFTGEGSFQALERALLRESRDRSSRFATAKDKSTLGAHTFSRAGMVLTPALCVAPDTRLLGDYLALMHTRELGHVFSADGNAETIRAAREYAFAMAKALDGKRKDAVKPGRRKEVLSSARDSTGSQLDRFQRATEALRTGRSVDVPAETPLTPSDIQKALASADELFRDDLLQVASRSIEPQVAIAEYAMAYQRSVKSAPGMDEAEQTARRRLAGLRTQPTLAKMVRLLVDVEVPLREIQMNSPADVNFDWFGEAAAEISPDLKVKSAIDADQLTVTRFRLHGQSSGGASRLMFGPASRYEWPQPMAGSRDRFLPLVNGFLHLRTDPGRFYLRTFDVIRGMNAVATGGGERESAKAKGAEEPGDRTPTLRSQGIELGDSKAGAEAAKDMLKSLGLSTRAEALYAEDLLMGFRVDIERTTGDDGGTRSRWSTATGRSLTYQDIPLVRGERHLFPAFEERDDGFVAPLLRHDADASGIWSFARQELVIWSGEPLALPAAKELPPGENYEDGTSANAGSSRIAGLVPSKDLNIGVEYGFAPGRRGLTPALRLGDKYRFVLRACYGNGGGPEFDPENLRQLYEASALGESGMTSEFRKSAVPREEPARFALPDPVAAPNLAMFLTDPLVSALNAEKDRPAEKFDQIVMRWENRMDRSARRIMLPPRVAFEQAEIQKQFDTIDDPRGALRFMHLDPVHGALPQAAGGHTTLEGEAGTHRGAVFILGSLGSRRRHPYFCDARGRCVVLSMHRAGSAPGDPSQPDVSLPLDTLRFWGANDHPDAAMPVVMEFRIAPYGATGARFAGPPEVKEYDSGGRFRALRVAVEIGLAERIELHAWCVDEHALEHNIFIRKLVEMKDSTKGSLAAFTSAFSAFKSLGKSVSKKNDDDSLALVRSILHTFALRPSLPLSDSLSFTAVAAVRRPLQPPRFVVAPNGTPVLIARRLRAAKAEARWKNVPRPPDEPEGTQLFIDGQIEVHRRSAGELRVQVLWRDFNDNVSVEQNKDGRYEFKPRGHTLERALSVPLSEQNAGEPFALADEAIAQGKPLTFGLGWQAVRVGVRLVSRTRFAHCYTQPQKQPGADDPSHFETENHPIDAFLKPGGLADAERSYWLPATQRPPRPEVSAVELVRHFKEVARSDTAVVAESHWTFRLRMPKGTWHQSGEGEMLAVVLLPQTAVSSVRSASTESRHRLDSKEFSFSDELRRLDLWLGMRFTDPNKAALPKLMQLVSGWAADPSTDAGRLQPVLSPGQFAGWREKRAGLPLPFSVEKDGGSTEVMEANVAIVAYEPLLDPTTADRYVDVDFLSPDIDSPFIRLSVARYQPHSLDGLWLSSQVALDPLTLPSRRRIEVDWSGASVLRVTVTGPAYRRRTLGRASDDPQKQEETLQTVEAHKIDVPWMRFSIQRVDGQGFGVLAADASGGELRATVAALVVGEQGLWEAEFRMPAGIRKWRVFVEEFEFFTTHPEINSKPELQEVPRGFKCELDVDFQFRPSPIPPAAPAPLPSKRPDRVTRKK